MAKYKITTLGEPNSTFSYQAYEILSQKYNAPKVGDNECISTKSNKEILGVVVKNGGYGVLAMETLSEARISETLHSFIDLMQK